MYRFLISSNPSVPFLVIFPLLLLTPFRLSLNKPPDHLQIACSRRILRHGRAEGRAAAGKAIARHSSPPASGRFGKTKLIGAASASALPVLLCPRPVRDHVRRWLEPVLPRRAVAAAGEGFARDPAAAAGNGVLKSLGAG